MTRELSYAACAHWGPRLELPESLAKRALIAFKRLQAVDPVFENWFTFSKQEGVKPFDLRLDEMTELTAANVTKSRDGSPQPCYGYQWTLYNSADSKRGPRDYYASLNAGGDIRTLTNTVHVSTPGWIDPDPSIAAFEIMRGALLALAEPFEASFARAFPNTLIAFWPEGQGPTLPSAWISYLAPRYAHLITPPPTAIVEYRSDGGLLMSATSETFDVKNPLHMAAAQDIETAVAPFNALPWPDPS